MILVGAGDFDAAEMAGQVKEIFGGMVRPRETIPPREEGKLDARSMRAGVFRISGVGSASTEAATVIANPNRPDTMEAHVERQMRQFVMDVFAERLRSD